MRSCRKPAASFLGALLLLISAASRSGANPVTASAEVERLRAFTKLYGYIRFFHPSDESSRIDWDRFASYGAERVLASASSDLQPTLESIFLPIAPTLRLYRTGETPPPPREGATPASGDSEVEVVAWQHRGVGLGGGGLYVSARTHRETRVTAANHGFASITQRIPGGDLRGKEVRLRAAVKAATSGGGGRGGLWLRVDRENKQYGFFDNMGDRPITVPEWHVYEIVGSVDADAASVVVGGLLAGTGKVWFDAFELAVHESDGTWRAIALENPGFESSATRASGWDAEIEGYSSEVEGPSAFAGKSCAVLENRTEPVTMPLFDTVPGLGEVLCKPIGAGLNCAFPVALPSVRGHTLPGADSGAFGALDAALAAFDPAAHDRARRAAAVLVAWNTLQHFYPYFDVVGADWDSELTRALDGALSAASELGLSNILNRMAAALRDGHARVRNQALVADRAGPSLAFDWIESTVTVVVSKLAEVAPGDVVVAVDGVAAQAALEKDEELISGSPQWRRVRALDDLGWGEKGSEVHLTLRRGARQFEVSASRDNSGPLDEPRPDAIASLAGGTYYVDLSRASMKEIESRLDALASAPGVVFDLRGYPNGNHDVLTHLTDTPIQSAKWNVPRFIYPDRERIAGWETSGRWELEPSKPRFRGRIVFLTDARAISYAESVMGIVEHYHLGEIVGQPTAGANGNVNRATLPGGFTLTFTGMKVLKHDDSQHYLIGIRPTVPVARTRAAVIEGRDEALEKALQLIRSAASTSPPSPPRSGS